MTAKVMFEELGFHIRTNNDKYLFYDKHSSNGNIVEHVSFYLENKPKNGFIPHYSTSKARNSACGWKMKSVEILPELHKAINQQMKELDWLEEES